MLVLTMPKSGLGDNKITFESRIETFQNEVINFANGPLLFP